MSGEVNVGAIAGSIVLTDETEQAVTKATERLRTLDGRFAATGQSARDAGNDLRSFGKDTGDTGDKVDDLAARLKKTQSNLSDFGSAARQMGAGMTAALTLPIVGAATAAVKLGMDAIESENLVAVAFGGMKKNADEWSKGLSKAVGLNEFELRKQSGTLFNMFTSMGLAKQGAFDMATGMTKLAADMASFRNISVDEAMVKLRSGIVGMSRPLQDIGIIVKENTIKQYAYKAGLAAYGAELTETQKVQARWLAILDQTKNDQGDLARTLDSPTNKLRLMGETIKQAGIELGMVLMPYAVKFIDLLASGIKHLSGWIETFGKLPEPVKLVALGFVAIAAAAGPVLLGFGVIAGAVNSAISLYRTLAIAQAAVAASNRAMAGSILAQSGFVQIGAEVAGGAMGGFKVQALGMVGSVTTAIGTAMTAVVGFLGWPLTLTIAIGAAAVAILSYFDMLGPVIDFFKDLWTIAVGVSKVLLEDLWGAVKAVAGGIFDFGKMVVGTAWAVDKWLASLIGIDLSAAVAAVMEFATAFKDGVVGAVTYAWDKITGWAKSVRTYLHDLAEAFRITLPEIHAPEGFRSITDQAKGLQAAMVPIPALAENTRTGFDRIADGIKQARAELTALSSQQKSQLKSFLKDGMSPTEISKQLQGSGTELSEKAIELFKKEQSAAESAGKAVKKHNEEMANATSSMDTLSGAQIEAIRYYKEQDLTVAQIAKQLEIYEHQVKQVEDADTKATKAKKEYAKALDEMARVNAQVVMSFKSIPEAENNMAGWMPDIAAIKSNVKAAEGLQQQHFQWLMGQGRASADEQRRAVADSTTAQLGELDRTKQGWELVAAGIIQKQYDMYDDIEAKEKDTLAKMKAAEFSWANSFKSFAGSVAPNISQALLNGTSIIKAFSASTSQVAADAGKRMFEFDGNGIANSKMMAGISDKIATGAGKLFGKGFGDAVFTAIPFIGGMIGALAGPLMEKAIGKIKEAFGGPSAKELEGRKTEETYEKGLAGSLTAADRLRVGTNQLAQAVEGLKNQYVGVGMSSEQAAAQAQIDMKRIMDAEKQGADAVKRVQDEIQARQDALKAVTGGIDDLASAVKNAGGRMPDYLKPAIAKFLEMKNLTDAQRKALEGLLTDAEPDYKKLTESAAKYGITLAGLGPKFQQADITDRAMQIAHDFEDITKAGGDVGNVVTGMSESVNKLVQDAMRFGSSIPEALRPVVENLFNTGRLVDENGDKITDLSKISFSQTPLEKSTDAIVLAIEKLTKLFENMPGVAFSAASGVADALGKIPDETHKKVFIDTQNGSSVVDPGSDVSNAATGGMVTTSGVKYLAKGGPVGIMRSLGFIPKGTDTVPAMLTPGERVLSVAENQAFTGLMGSLSGAASSMSTIGGMLGGIFGAAKPHVLAISDELRGMIEAAGKAEPVLVKVGASIADDIAVAVDKAAASASKFDLSQPVDGVGDDWKMQTDVIRNCWGRTTGDMAILLEQSKADIALWLKSIPTEVSIPVVTHGGLSNKYGNDWTPNGGPGDIQYLAGGGEVDAWPARGTDTVRAMLSPGERVLSVDENSAFKAGIALASAGASTASGSGEDSVVNVHAHLMLDGKHVTTVVLNDIIHDKGGAKQKIRRAVRK